MSINHQTFSDVGLHIVIYYSEALYTLLRNPLMVWSRYFTSIICYLINHFLRLWFIHLYFDSTRCNDMTMHISPCTISFKIVDKDKNLCMYMYVTSNSSSKICASTSQDKLQWNIITFHYIQHILYKLVVKKCLLRCPQSIILWPRWKKYKCLLVLVFIVCNLLPGLPVFTLTHWLECSWPMADAIAYSCHQHETECIGRLLFLIFVPLASWRFYIPLYFFWLLSL